MITLKLPYMPLALDYAKIKSYSKCKKCHDPCCHKPMLSRCLDKHPLCVHNMPSNVFCDKILQLYNRYEACVGVCDILHHLVS